MSERPPTRRRFLATLAALPLAACDETEPRAGLLGAMERVNERLQRALFDPARLAPELPASAETVEAAFPVYHIAPSVPVAPAGWALEVSGAVRAPRRFSLADLMRMEATETRVRHHCVEGWSAVASWRGVRVRELARIVGADPRARFVEFRSFDEDYYSCWDTDSALHPQTLLAYGMNGHPLTPAHGAPVRLYGAVKLGYKMVKYLTRVSFSTERTGGYWEDQGYEWYAGV